MAPDTRRGGAQRIGIEVQGIHNEEDCR
jgi:hypothetical protein